MGILSTVADRARAALATASQLPLVQGDVAQVADLPPEVQAAFGIAPGDGQPITRKDAMRVPAFARGRNTIAGTVGLLSLVEVKAGQVQPDVRPLLVQPDVNTTRQHTLTWTVDDLLCHGLAWWQTDERDAFGWPLHGHRVAPGRVQVDRSRGRADVDGNEVPLRDLIRFDAPHEGVLSYGGDVLRGALALERAVKRYADNPEPSALLFDKRPIEADTPELPKTKVKELLATWRNENANSSTRWLNRMVGYQRLSYTPAELDLTAARQQAAVQIARLLGMPSRQVNAPSESGMTYQNVSADRQEVLDTTCAAYLTAIEQRLSMNDITPRGRLVAFDRDAYVAGTLNDRIGNAAEFVSAGLGDVDEARGRYLGLGPLTDEQRSRLTPRKADTP